MKIKTLLTFDYEVYFGKNHYNDDEVLFKPTDNLLKVLNKNNIKATFFIDICSIIGYEKNNQHKYVQKFKQQVKKISAMGHSVQMHFHPHWFYSKYDEKMKKWSFDYKNYSYSQLIENFGLEKANALFIESHKLFKEVLGYSPIAFRAGGYSVYPYESELINLLSSLGYKIDSSVIPHKKYFSDIQNFNFFESESVNKWRLSEKEFKAKGKSSIFEFPILSPKKNFFNLLIYILLRLYNKIIPEVDFDSRGNGAKPNIHSYLNRAYQYTFDKTSKKNIKIIKFITKLYVNSFKNENEIYLITVSHPKAIFGDSLEVINWYIYYMKSKYSSEFIGFNELDLSNEK